MTKREGKPAKGSTYETTYALVREGMGIDEIASTRSMAKSTIEGHFARGIAEGAESLLAKLIDHSMKSSSN